MKFKKFFIEYYIPFIACALFFFMLTFVFLKPKNNYPTKALASPPLSPFEKQVAGLGIIETATENIELSTSYPGTLQTIHVKPGQKIAANELLFTIDERPTEAALEVKKRDLEEAKFHYEDLSKQYTRYKKLKGTGAITLDDIDKKYFAREKAKAKVGAIQAKINELIIKKDMLNVKSPISGIVLKIHGRIGEYINQKTVMIIGDNSKHHVRCEFDEIDIRRIKTNGKAIGLIRGHPQNKITLKYIRTELLLTAKKIFTPDGNERFDTRVQQIIFEIDDNNPQIAIGQQIYVYIEAEDV